MIAAGRTDRVGNFAPGFKRYKRVIKLGRQLVFLGPAEIAADGRGGILRGIAWAMAPKLPPCLSFCTRLLAELLDLFFVLGVVDRQEYFAGEVFLLACIRARTLENGVDFVVTNVDTRA